MKSFSCACPHIKPLLKGLDIFLLLATLVISWATRYWLAVCKWGTVQLLPTSSIRSYASLSWLSSPLYLDALICNCGSSHHFYADSMLSSISTDLSFILIKLLCNSHSVAKRLAQVGSVACCQLLESRFVHIPVGIATPKCKNIKKQ